jgi:hypothetical protein
LNPFTSVRSWIRRHPVISIVSAAAGVGLAAWLVFGVFAFHLVFVDEVVSEADPFAAASDAAEVAGDPPAGEASTTDEASATDEVMEAEETPSETVDAVPAPADSPAPPSVVAAGDFVRRSHPTTGRAEVVTDGNRRVLRLEDLRTDNGPDLNVYLVAAEPDAPVGELAADFVDLGDLKGNIGDQNYMVPDSVDLDRYTTVVIWCVRFSVAFGAAGLA